MTIIYRTTNLSEWGAGKGSNLTAAEVDANFWDLSEQIANIEVQEGVGIASASVTGDQLSFTLTDNSILGPFTLPTVTLNPRGSWQAGTSYAVNDIFTQNGSVYIVIFAHTSAVTFNAGANNGSGQDFYKALVSIPNNALPVGGITGQVLSKFSNVDFSTSWATPRYVPNGGTEGQALVKLSDNSFDYGWESISSIPAGGASGAVLSKASATDYDAAWTVLSGLAPSGGTSNQVLAKNSGTNYDYSWVNVPRTDLVTASVTASTGFTTIDASAADIFEITMAANSTIQFTQFSKKPIWIILKGAATTYTATFSSSYFRSQGTLSVAGASSIYVLAFIPIQSETKYAETSRTTAI